MRTQYQEHRRGTVLVLVVVLLALLAIMGTSFVISMRIEGVAAENRQVSFAERQVLQASIDSIESRIVDTLELDLWGKP
ncbi:MAG: hypothetical protein GXY33_00315, partial [Phycisphaerae bacterium]|nr:hypothetical protein [Phycisphaerae bacterium]